MAPRVILGEQIGEPNDGIITAGVDTLLSVSVEDGQGNALPGAHILLYGSDAGVTGDDGRLSFSWTPPYEQFYDLQVFIPGREEPIVTRLAALSLGSAVLEVLGFDRDGALFPNMFVSTFEATNGGRGNRFETGAVQVIAYAGQNDIAVESQPRAGAAFQMRLSAQLPAGRRTRVVADGMNTVLLSIAIRDGGAAVPGARVYLSSTEPRWSWSPRYFLADAAGNLSVYTSQSGTYAVGFWSPTAFGAKGSIWVGPNGGQATVSVDEASPEVILAVAEPAGGALDSVTFQAYNADVSPSIWLSPEPGRYRVTPGTWDFVGTVRVLDADQAVWTYRFYPRRDQGHPSLAVLEPGSTFRFEPISQAGPILVRPSQAYANAEASLQFFVGGEGFWLYEVGHDQAGGGSWVYTRPEVTVKNAGGQTVAEGVGSVNWTPLQTGSYTVEGRYTGALGPYFPPDTPLSLKESISVLPEPSGPPRWPAGAAMTAVPSGRGAAELQWPTAEHELPVFSYRLFQDDVQIGWSLSHKRSFTVTGLIAGATYRFRVVAEGRYGTSQGLELEYTHTLTAQPSLAVMIDNAPEARPQSGLAKAQVIYEAAIAPGITRYLAIYDPAVPVASIGPVRSARDSLAALAAGHGGALAHAGGSPSSLALLPQVPLLDLNELTGAGAYFERSPDRPTPHNLYASTASLTAGVQALGGRFAPGGFPGFPTGDVAGGQPQSQVEVTFPHGGPTVAFHWDATEQRYTRLVDGRVDRHDTGQPVTASNVVVLHVPYSLIYRADVEEWELVPDVTGVGTATFHRGGSAWSGQWSKPSPDSPLLLTVDGESMRFAPGVTWVLLAGLPPSEGAPTVTGRVLLPGRQAPVFLGLRGTRIATVAQPGQPFSLPVAGPGTYELMVYAPGYLRHSYTITLGPEPLDLGTVTLTPGDFDEDGAVGPGDLEWLTGYWRRSVPGGADSTAVMLSDLVKVARASGQAAPPQALPPAAPTVYLDGQTFTYEVAPVLEHGLLYVPVRLIAEVYGLDLGWDPVFRKVTLTDGKNRYEFYEGGPTLVNGVRVPWPAAARIVSGRTLVPMDLVAALLGLNVQGGPATKVYWFGPRSQQ